MANVSVPGAIKPITLLATQGRLNLWLRSGESILARAPCAQSKAVCDCKGFLYHTTATAPFPKRQITRSLGYGVLARTVRHGLVGRSNYCLLERLRGLEVNGAGCRSDEVQSTLQIAQPVRTSVS